MAGPLAGWSVGPLAGWPAGGFSPRYGDNPAGAERLGKRAISGWVLIRVILSIPRRPVLLFEFGFTYLA